MVCNFFKPVATQPNICHSLRRYVLPYFLRPALFQPPCSGARAAALPHAAPLRHRLQALKNGVYFGWRCQCYLGCGMSYDRVEFALSSPFQFSFHLQRFLLYQYVVISSLFFLLLFSMLLNALSPERNLTCGHIFCVCAVSCSWPLCERSQPGYLCCLISYSKFSVQHGRGRRRISCPRRARVEKEILFLMLSGIS